MAARSAGAGRSTDARFSIWLAIARNWKGRIMAKLASLARPPSQISCGGWGTERQALWAAQTSPAHRLGISMSRESAPKTDTGSGLGGDTTMAPGDLSSFSC